MKDMLRTTGVLSRLLSQRFSVVENLEAKLVDIVRRISNSSYVITFLRAPDLAKKLEEVGFKLDQRSQFSCEHLV